MKMLSVCIGAVLALALSLGGCSGGTCGADGTGCDLPQDDGGMVDGGSNDGGTPDTPVLSVTGQDGCLAFEFSTDKGLVVHGTYLYFTPRVTNTCAEPWTFTGGCYPLKAAILTRGVPFDRQREWGMHDGIVYLELPAGDCGAVNTYTYQQGETCEYEGQPQFISWDPKIGDSGGNNFPVPAGWYDVYLLSYGKTDGPFSGKLLVEVRVE